MVVTPLISAFTSPYLNISHSAASGPKPTALYTPLRYAAVEALSTPSNSACGIDAGTAGARCLSIANLRVRSPKEKR
jgi:hypothetical protein